MSDEFGLNYLTANRAVLRFVNLPKISFTLQEFGLPSIQLPPVVVPNPFVDRPVFGDKLIYDDLNISFLVTEKLANYLEFHDWLRTLGAPFEKEEHRNRPFTFSDATITLYTSHNNPIIEYNFEDCVPIYLSSLDFSEQTMETTPIKASATIKYSRYDIKVL